MLEYHTLIDGLYSYFPGAPEPLLVNMWRRTARDFFEHTRAWVEDAVVTAVNSDFSEYTLAPLSPQIEMFDIAPRGLTIGTDSDVAILSAAKFRHFQAANAQGGGPGGYYARFHYPNAVEIGPKRRVDLRPILSVRVAVCPAHDSTGMDAAVVSRFRETIEAGTIANVLLLPQQPWMTADAWGRHEATTLYRVFHDKYTEARDMVKGLAADDMHVGVARRVRYGGY